MIKIDHKTVLRLIVGPLTVVGFFGVIAALLYVAVFNGGKFQLDEGLKALLLILIGALGRDHGTLISFLYGSSTGSERKTELMSGREGR